MAKQMVFEGVRIKDSDPEVSLVHSNEAMAVFLTKNMAYKVFQRFDMGQDAFDRMVRAADEFDIPIPSHRRYIRGQYNDGSKDYQVGILRTARAQGKHYCQKHKGWQKVIKKIIVAATERQARKFYRGFGQALIANVTDPQFLLDELADQPLYFIDIHFGNTRNLDLEAWINELADKYPSFKASRSYD